ncbi:MAG: PAS domain S-box protein, partial [Dehalococcoidia bacterium]
EMLDFLPISTFEIDTAARITSFNQTALKVFGYSQEDYKEGMNASQFFSPKELQRFGENFGKVMEGKSIPGDEYVFLRKDGSTFIGLIYATPVFRQNKLAGVRGAIVDITRRKQAEEQLVESEEQLRNALENAPDGVYMNDLEGNFLYGNLKCEDIIGYKREELIGKNFQQLNLLADTSLARAVELLQENINGKSTGPDELELIGKGGRRIPVEINTSVLQLKGRPIVLAFVRDISERLKIEQERQKAAARIEDLYNNAPAGYHSLDKDGTYVRVNDTELAWLGYKRDELVGKKKFTDFLTADGREAFQREFPDFKESGRVKGLDIDMVRKDGTIFTVLVNATALKDESGNFLMSRTTLFDITEIKRLQQIIAESEKRFRTILEEMNDSYFELDMANNFTFVNRMLCRELGYSREELIGTDSRPIIAIEYRDEMHERFTQVVLTGEPQIGLVFKYIRKDGMTGFGEISVSPQKDASGKVVGFRCLSRNVTEREELKNKLSVMAMHDALTGLPNRSLLYDRFNIACAQAQRNNRKLAVMELDLDYFKTINDNLGHAAGDELLKATADRLSAMVRKSDTVARLGGDEFVVLIPEFTNIKDALKTAQKIHSAFQKPFVIEGQELHVTTSIGIAVYPRDGSNIEDLLKAADTAMYYTKEHGRNNYKLSGDKARARAKA